VCYFDGPCETLSGLTLDTETEDDRPRGNLLAARTLQSLINSSRLASSTMTMSTVHHVQAIRDGVPSSPLLTEQNGIVAISG
jgi:hypothetical protein